MDAPRAVAPERAEAWAMGRRSHGSRASSRPDGEELGLRHQGRASAGQAHGNRESAERSCCGHARAVAYRVQPRSRASQSVAALEHVFYAKETGRLRIRGAKTVDTLMQDVAACSAHLEEHGSPTGFLSAAEEGQAQTQSQ